MKQILLLAVIVTLPLSAANAQQPTDTQLEFFEKNIRSALVKYCCECHSVESGDLGYEAVEGRVHTHDWHATILYLLGLDHERLTYRHAGRDFRLTDVGGKVAKEILA